MPAIYKNIQVAYVDCDEAEELVENLNVETVQTVLVMHPIGSEARET